METASLASSAAADASLELDHWLAPRRAAGARGTRRRRPGQDEPGRDAFETRARARPARAPTRVALLVVVGLATADILLETPPLHFTSWVLAVLLAGLASLVAVTAAESAGVDQTSRWHIQAMASAVFMFMLMAGTPATATGDPLWLVIVVGTAAALVAMATTYGGERSIAAALCLALDATVVGIATALVILALGSSEGRPVAAAIMVGAFAAAGYATAVATRPAVRDDPRGADALFIGSVLVLCMFASGAAADKIGAPFGATLAAPGVALFGSLGLARSAWSGLRAASHASPRQQTDVMPESRLRLVPAVFAVGAILVLSWTELTVDSSRTGFFGIVSLFALIVGRLLLTLVENRHLLQRVERSGVFEEKLRDLGGALVAALDRKNTLELVCRTAQLALGADSVLLWMLDSGTDELEAVEVLGSKRDSLLGRRLHVQDPTSLAVRVARTGAAEIVTNAGSANLSNGFLNVLLHASCLLAVPVVHGGRVQGVLTCVDSRSPTAYGPRELAKAELLASQVAVALDNAYQHALQRRRLEELSALYQFAQSAHTAMSGTEVARQLLPILKERLSYTTATIWLRDEGVGSLRLAVGEGPNGPVRALRPSAVGIRAFVTGEPARADDEYNPALDSQPMGSHVAVPMVLKRRVVGVVDLEHREAHAYTPTEERLLVALANHAALALDNLHLLEETRKVVALRELDRMKTELLSTVSHELRTPLGSIKGYATTLLTHGNKLKRDEQREFLEIIDSEADRLRELIENLLDMSRLEAGVLRIDREPARLGGIVHEVTRKVQLAAPEHELIVDWPAADPLVEADPKRVYQVVQNLLTNAVKYSPDGGRIWLTGEVHQREVVLAVADEGLGMPPAELDKIFDRFHRVGGEVSRRVGGTGLGLAICKGLIDAHRGRIWAESEGEGMGSVFRFTLPLLPEGGDVAVSARVSSSRSKGAHVHQEANRSRR